jgi:hypothetical protein
VDRQLPRHCRGSERRGSAALWACLTRLLEVRVCCTPTIPCGRCAPVARRRQGVEPISRRFRNPPLGGARGWMAVRIAPRPQRPSPALLDTGSNQVKSNVGIEHPSLVGAYSSPGDRCSRRDMRASVAPRRCRIDLWRGRGDGLRMRSMHDKDAPSARGAVSESGCLGLTARGWIERSVRLSTIGTCSRSIRHLVVAVWSVSTSSEPNGRAGTRSTHPFRERDRRRVLREPVGWVLDGYVDGRVGPGYRHLHPCLVSGWRRRPVVSPRTARTATRRRIGSKPEIRESHSNSWRTTPRLSSVRMRTLQASPRLSDSAGAQ